MMDRGKTMNVLYLDEGFGNHSDSVSGKTETYPKLLPGTITVTDSDGKQLFTGECPAYTQPFPQESYFNMDRSFPKIFTRLPEFVHRIPELRHYVRDWYEEFAKEFGAEPEIPTMKLADKFIGVYTPIHIHLDMPKPKKPSMQVYELKPKVHNRCFGEGFPRGIKYTYDYFLNHRSK